MSGQSPVSTISTPPSTPESPEQPHNKSVNFAPLSPTSSRRLSRIRDDHERNIHLPKRASTYQAPDSERDDDVYDSSSSPDDVRHRHRHHRRSRRRNSDPSSDRPSEYDRERRRKRKARTRSPSPASSSSDIEVLPDRFDRDGRPIDGSRGGAGGETEMVERVVRDFGDVVDGRKSWKDLLADLVGNIGGDGDGRRRR